MGIRVLVLCVFLAVNSLLVYKAVWGSSGLLEYRALREQQQEAAARSQRLDEENKALSREIRLLQNDPEYIEKMVRERLHYLHDNEILYLFGDEDEPVSAVR